MVCKTNNLSHHHLYCFHYKVVMQILLHGHLKYITQCQSRLIEVVLDPG